MSAPTIARAALRGAALLAAALLALPLVAAASDVSPVPLTRAELLPSPPFAQVELSPDGRWLALARHTGDGTEVALQSVADGTRRALVHETRAVELAWSGDGARLWIADHAGLAVAEAPAFLAKRILRWDAAQRQRFWRVDPRAPRFAVLHEQSDTPGARHRYLRVDAQGRRELLHEATQPLRDVLLTPDGTLAFIAAFEGEPYDTVIRGHSAHGMQELIRCSGIETCRLVGADAVGHSLFVLAPHEGDRLALRRWRADDGAWTTVHHDPEGIADADRVWWDGARADWRAIAYHRAQRVWYGQSARDRIALATLAKRWPRASLELSLSTGDGPWLVRVQQSNQPIDRHVLFWPGSERTDEPFAREEAPALATDRLVEAMPFEWQASDGMRLHGYLYPARGVAPAAAPLVAWLHGGPVARNHDQYHAALQLLAQRGVHVFLPDFRGSSGYGLRYVQAARGDVGHGRVLADIVEGMDAVLARGFGDRTQQAVVGHSFGGYAALLAVTHQPERFRFALAAAPPTDYGWTKAWQAAHDDGTVAASGRPAAIEFVQHGFRFDDPAWRSRMTRDSPLAGIERLRAPLYLWAGARDPRVPLKSVTHYAAAARGAGKAVTLLVDPDAGHVPATPLGAEAWLYLLEHAAARHFGSATTPASPALQDFLRAHQRFGSD